jgi:hypothetical protein
MMVSETDESKTVTTSETTTTTNSSRLGFV